MEKGRKTAKIIGQVGKCLVSGSGRDSGPWTDTPGSAKGPPGSSSVRDRQGTTDEGFSITVIFFIYLFLVDGMTH